MKEVASNTNSIPDLFPASMVRDYAYCSRQCYIRWNEGEFADCPDASDSDEPRQIDDRSRSVSISWREVHLTAPLLGLTCALRVMDGQGRNAVPVLLKRGEAASVSGEVYDSDRIYLCAQGLILRESGFFCQEGLAYFARSRKAVPINFDEPLVERTKEVIAAIRRMAWERRMPPPLKDSSKCNRCVFAGICLPDEVNLFLAQKQAVAGDKGTGEIRMLLPARNDRVPVYVVDQGSSVHKKGDCLEIRSREGKLGSARMMDVSQICLYGGVEISTPAVVELMQRGIPVLHFTHGGWFEGICLGHTSKNIDLRIRQFEWARDHSRSLSLARSMISGKIRNSRILLRRNDQEAPEVLLEKLAEYAARSEGAESFEALLGLEGAAAEMYFSRLGSLLKTDDEMFLFSGRNRRPPRDPVNAVLSYLYGILAKECFVTLLSVGFEPYLGFYHQPRYGRPALALDLMEEFRPLIADSTMVSLFNNKELDRKDFIITEEGVMIAPSAKRKVVGGYERRMDSEITHPIFGYKICYRKVLEVQARLLARVLYGEIEGYPAFVTR